MAGSAPLLALIPLAVNQRPYVGLIYLLIFSCGVISAMLLFGGALNALSAYLYRTRERVMFWFRMAIGLATIAVGAMLMLQVAR